MQKLFGVDMNSAPMSEKCGKKSTGICFEKQGDEYARRTSIVLDKVGNTCDNGLGSSLMEFNKRIYLLLLVLVALWCGGLLLAPALRDGVPAISSFLYSFYAPICHQIDGRSFHLFGGKLAVCSRCSMIYIGFLVSLLLYPSFQNIQAPAYPGRRWIAFAVFPMLIDVLLNLSGYHESTIVTRAITGILFGLIVPYYLVPPLVEGIAQLRDQHIARGGFRYARKTQ